MKKLLGNLLSDDKPLDTLSPVGLLMAMSEAEGQRVRALEKAKDCPIKKSLDERKQKNQAWILDIFHQAASVACRQDEISYSREMTSFSVHGAMQTVVIDGYTYDVIVRQVENE